MGVAKTLTVSVRMSCVVTVSQTVGQCAAVLSVITCVMETGTWTLRGIVKGISVILCVESGGG